MRLRLTALMISLVLLCGCSGGTQDRERVETLRSRIGTAAGISFRAELETDDGSSRERYVYHCTRSDTETVIELLEPELIGGVTAHISGGNTELSYDGLSFEVGALDQNGLSPIRAPALFLSALEKGVVSQLRRETLDGTETIAFRVLSVSGYDTDIWIDAQTLSPRRAEILADGRAAVCCGIAEWNIKEG